MSANAQQQPANGHQGSPEVIAGAAGAAGTAARVQADRAAVRAEILKGDDATSAKEPAAKAAKVEAPAAEEPSVDAAPAGDEDVEQDGAAPDDAAPTAKADKTDPDTAKRLAAVQAAEKRSREKLAAERKQLEDDRAAHAKERAELDKARAELAEFNKLRERAPIDPVAALEALGLTNPADLEHAAKQAYARAKNDPANKDAAARMLRERELAAQLAKQAEETKKLQERLDAREKAEQESARAAIVRQKTEEYIAGVVKAVDAADAPLAKQAMAKNPERAKARFQLHAMELLDETGDIPDAADVLARYEKTRRAELEELGIDPDSLTTPGQKKNDQPAAKKNAAKTLGNDLSTTRVPRPPSSDRELRAQVRAQLESGKLD